MVYEAAIKIVGEVKTFVDARAKPADPPWTDTEKQELTIVDTPNLEVEKEDYEVHIINEEHNINITVWATQIDPGLVDVPPGE